MCRLYTFRSSAPRKVECELLCAQNSLIEQSRQDEVGDCHPHGWGLGTYTGSTPFVVRQPKAAYDSERFRTESADIHAHNVVAHVRRATVGSARVENTHPFAHGRWLLAHNGTIPAFDRVRPLILDVIDPDLRRAIRGDTDSEHLFFMFLSLNAKYPTEPLLAILRRGLEQVLSWSEPLIGDADRLTADIVLTNGEDTVGVRYGRPLWFVERDAVHPCELCDCEQHVVTPSPGPYRAVAIASEPITETEDWTMIPDATLFHVGPEIRIRFESIQQP